MSSLLGAKLRYLRLLRRLTQGELANQLGLNSHAHLSNIESGRRPPSVSLVIDIADFFEVRTDYLLKDDISVETVVFDIPPNEEGNGSYETFGEQLRQLRKARQLTQVELAERLGLKSRSYLSDLEASDRLPSIDFILRTAQFFDVSIDYLLRSHPTNNTA